MEYRKYGDLREQH